MTITARSPWGDYTFPDNTAPEIIDRTVKADVAHWQSMPSALQRARQEAVRQGREPAGWKQTVSQASQGVSQAMLDPPEGVAQAAAHVPVVGPALQRIPGMDYVTKQAEELRRQSEATPAAQAGRIGGTLLNPLWRFLPELKFAEETGPAVVRGIGHVARQALRSGAAAATQPVDDSKGDFWGQKEDQGEWGAGIGALLSGPGGLARLIGYEDLPTALHAVESHIPGVKQIFAAARSLSMPDFNRAWYRYVMKPLGLEAPAETGHKGLASLADQIGLKLDQATAGASFDVNAAGGIRAWNLLLHFTQKNLSGDAFKKFQSIVNSYVGVPLGHGSGTLNSKMFQKVTSDLQAQIRAIKPTSEDNRALRSELEDFRFWILDNATYGSPQQKAAYTAARDAWKRFATARDAVPADSGTGLFTPASLAAQLDRRYPNKAPLGRAPGQDLVSIAQRALLLPGRAATNVVEGRPPLISELPVRAGAVAGEQEGESP